MSECQVLRCSKDASRVVEWNPPDTIRLAGAVCDDHGARMDAGEPWAHQEEGAGSMGTGSAFLMGDDLAAADLVVLTEVGGNNRTVLADRTRPWTMRIEGTRYGDDAPVDMAILLTPEAAQKLRRSLDLWAPED